MADRDIPEGGLTAYVNRVRESHQRLPNGWCSCDMPLCPQRYLLDHIDNLVKAYELKVQDFARETARHAAAIAPVGDRDIPEEMVEKEVARVAHEVYEAWRVTANRDAYVADAIRAAASQAVSTALAGRQVVDTSMDDLDPEALNVVANAVHDHYGFVRLDVRYAAAAAAIRIVEERQATPILGAAGSGSGED